MVLRRLPEAVDRTEKASSDSTASNTTPNSILFAKGLPVKAYSKTKVLLKLVSHKVWQFLLEAKGLKQAPKISYNFQKVNIL